VGPDAQSLLVARFDRDDPLMAAVLTEALQATAVRRQVPAKDGGPIEVSEVNAADIMDKVRLVQIVATARVEEGDTVKWGLAASLNRWWPAVAFMVKAHMNQTAEEGTDTLERYKDALVLVTPNGSCGMSMGNNFGLASESATARYWADRIEAQRRAEDRGDWESVPAPPLETDEELKDAYALLDASAPVRFCTLNNASEIAWAVSRLPDGRARKLLLAAGAAGPDIVSAAGQVETLNSRDGALTLLIGCRTEETADRLRRAFGALATDPEAAPVFTDIGVDQDVGKVVTFRARVPDLPQKAVRLLTFLAEQE
jgi:hypothetical protein